YLLVILLVFGFLATPALAQMAAPDNDSNVFSVADVAVDATADNGVHARDLAIAQAQRAAFDQLLDRLGADSSMEKKLSDDDIATLVQNFEVQSERTSATRYIGTYTVQFRPTAVRDYLGKHNTSYTETRAKPIVVMPIFANDGHPILWEDKTKWRMAWDADARSGGLVPVIIPTGELADVAIISTTDAMHGKSDAIKDLIDRYHANGAIVTVLDTDLEKPGKELKVSVERYDTDGQSIQPDSNFTLPAATDKPALDRSLMQAVKQVRHQLEKAWRSEEASGVSAIGGDAPVIIEGEQHSNVTHLPISVAIATLPEWTQIKRKLESIPAITHIDVIILQRVETSIEIQFKGDIDALQMALEQKGLILNQTPEGWNLQQAPQ
ncbi:MAG TPA: DUF2066 domain-containing protein, partial [Alphaproteobacteria bacterium]|nr:DUF2066 domain-containing protein [Alphaproteobacteria bacterium]